LRLYQETEIAVAQILEAAGEDVTVCIMSDHGFGPTRHQVWLNNWLVQQGFLSLKPSFGVGLKKLLYRAGLSPAAIREMAPERLKLAILQFFERQKGRALASELERDSAEVRRKGLMDWLTERLAVDFYDVNWAKTRAFSTGTTSVGYVWLNLAGRDPQGIVQSGSEYEQTRQEIARALKAWEPVGEVLFREDVWQGGKLEQAPDIIVRWARPSTDARYFQTRFSSHHLMKAVPNDYAGHRPEGVFAFYGPGVKGGRQLDADLLDLTPTLLWLLEQPVPTNMDGRILQELFSHQHDPTFVEPQAIEEDESGLSESDEAAIMQSLKNLGYIE
jgi:predicted AlkP superfamily phosphohydrolase/phosphomutase